MKKLTTAQASDFNQALLHPYVRLLVKSPSTRALVAYGLLCQEGETSDYGDARFVVVKPTEALKAYRSHGGVKDAVHGTFLLAWDHIDTNGKLTKLGQEAMDVWVLIPSVTAETVSLEALEIAAAEVMKNLETAKSAMGFEGQRAEADKSMASLRHVLNMMREAKKNVSE